MRGFDHERLDAYQAALDFVVLANTIIAQLPRGRSHLADQLHRSATSVCLNIAEGAGEFSTRDKARFYRVAQRSATESAAILDVFARVGGTDPSMLASGRELLLRLVAMLTRLAKKSEDGGARAAGGSGGGE